MTTAVESAPALVVGDRLSREEFLRRWEAAPEFKLAELIGGIVYMPPPVRASHSTSDNLIGVWLGLYANSTPGCEAGQNATWLMLDDAPQPDAHLRITEERGGRSTIDDDYFHGAPELAAEVSLSSTSYDLNQKKDLYAAAGVREYVAVLGREREVRWHRLVGDEYQELDAGPDGIIRSVVFPGLWLNVEALLRRSSSDLLATLDRGLRSPEHAEFAEYLAARKRRTP